MDIRNPVIRLYEEQDQKWREEKEKHGSELYYHYEHAPLFADHGDYDSDRNPLINITDIETFLIQQAGRFCERHASDLMIDHDRIRKILENPNAFGPAEYLCFGLRKNGVDGMSYVINQMHDYDPSYVQQYYRKLYVMKIKKYREKGRLFASHAAVELRDLTSDLYSLTTQAKRDGFTTAELFPETPEAKELDILYNLCQMDLLCHRLEQLQSNTATLLRETSLENGTDYHEISESLGATNFFYMKTRVRNALQKLADNQDPNTNTDRPDYL